MFMGHRNRGLQLEGQIIHLVTNTVSVKVAYDALVFW